MFRGLVISAVFVLGIAVGCAQQDGTTGAVLPDTPAPTVADTGAVDDRNTATPVPTETAAAIVPGTPAAPAPARARQAPPQRGGFVPLDDPTFLAAAETDYFGDEELVLGVEFAGEVRAYPVRMLRYHHIVNDTVRGEPLLVTY
ncbi:MAG: DUF3179 domain-containing protein [Chloroflexi bacterium]|nr:DUF3179 domain-containing protein [Chloroflexota bacterium]